MERKRILALALTCMLALGLTACGEQSAEPTPTPNAGNTPNAVTEKYTYADTIAWDGQYDVVVIGFGGAGAVASVTAADEGANVLLLEKAPEGHEGGNTRYCGQMFVYGDEDEEATYNYYKALAGDHTVDEEMLRVYTQKVAHMYDVMEDLTGIDQSGYWDAGEIIRYLSPEYPELPGAEHITLNALHNKASDGYLWQTLRGLVTERSDKIDVWFESPAVHLIQEPETKTIIGVQVERDGKTLNIRATNGVVMTCGGFENNAEMVQNYLGLTDYGVIGTLYNTGDGINMAMEVGADLWHMEAYEGGIAVSVPDDAHISMYLPFTSGAAFVVGGDGNRYFSESQAATSRHGHLKLNDCWVNIRHPLRSYGICTEEVYLAAVAKGYISEQAIEVQHASSIAELAELIDMDADTLMATVERYNGYAKDGYDPEFGRSAESMSAFEGDSFYAVKLSASVLNTQGGARRNVNAEILDTNGNPIPHLYSAGEFGGITAFQYQGGGNIAECVIFGQIAGKNAAAVKEELPTYEPRQQVTSSYTYTIGTASDLGGGVEVELGENEYLGTSANGMGGELIVKITMDGDKIANVEIVKQNETVGISDPAREQLPALIVEANSTEVDNISGATITSKAIKEAVENALAQVK